MDNCLINCGWWIIDTRPLRALERLGSAAARLFLTLRAAAAGWMDGWIISLSPLFLLLQEMMMMHSFITAPQRHFFLWARSRVFSPRVCAPGFFFRVGCGCAGAHPLCATAVKGARKFTPRPVLILMEQDAWWLLLDASAARPSAHRMFACYCPSSSFCFIFFYISPREFFGFWKQNPAGKEETFFWVFILFF